MVYKGGKSNRSPSCIFVGNLPEKVDDRDLHDLFEKFGEIKDVDIKHGKTSNYTAYAFVEFASVRSAEDAVDSRDGYEFDRYRLRVEFAGERRPRRYSEYEDRGRDRDRGSRYPPPKRTDYRLVISNLPHGCRWQHLKDHMRKAGPVGYVNIVHGKGYVDFMHRSDMKYALRKLDGSELSTPDDTSRIKIRRDDYRRSRSYSRGSRSVSEGRSHSLKRRSRSVDRRSRSLDRKSHSVDRRSDSLEKRSRSLDRSERSRSRTRSVSRDRDDVVSRSRTPVKRSRSYDRRSGSVDRRSRSLDTRSRSADRYRSPTPKRSRSYSVDRRSVSDRQVNRSRTYSERSRSREDLKLNTDLDPVKTRYDRDAETETAAETYRDSPLQV